MARSYLYVAGDAPDQLTGAFDRGADAVIADLEAAVALEAKQAARATVADWLRTVPAGAEAWVRISPGPLGHDDARAIVSAGVRGLCVAKTESAIQLDALDAVLSTIEQEAGLAARTVALAPLLESANGVLAAATIARAPRVVRLQLGEAALRAELGVIASADERELLSVRSQVVLASAAAGLSAPVASVPDEVDDLDRLRESTLALKRLGFRGRACVHPAQIPVLNEVFTPSAEEIAAARDVVERYAAWVLTGSGLCLDAVGRLIDEATVRVARRTLSAPR